MTRRFTAVLGAATIFVAAFGLSGCGEGAPPEPSRPSSPSSAAAAPPEAAPLPDPAALTDVLAKLTDPAVPGQDKLVLVEGSDPGDVETLDAFAKALADNHMLPLTFTATGLAWADADVVGADVTLTSSKPETGPFSFPMQFNQAQTGWQLSRDTADLLFAFGEPPR